MVRTLGIPAAGLAVLLAATGCLTPYEKGTSYYESGEYADARTALEEGLARNPDDPKLNLAMAKTLVAQEEFREAESYAKRAFDADPTRGPGGRLLGKIHWELGRALRAVEVWRETRSVDASLVPDEDYKRALVAAIGTADSSHKFQRALELRRELESIAPDHPEVDATVMRRTRENRAKDLVQRGEYEEAARVYAKLAEGADGGSYAFERGRLLLRLKRPDEARSSFDRYIESAGRGERVDRVLEVARRAKELNAPRVAVEYYRGAIDSLREKPTFRRAKLRLTLAKLLFKTDQSDRARNQIRSYLEDMRELRGVPLSAEVYLTAAETAGDASRTGFASDLLETALEEAPPNWTVASRLAQQYAVQARQNEAERVLDRYIDRSKSTAKALKNAARWARDRRNYDLAKHYYERLLEADPKQPKVWVELGKLYAQLGQIENMKRALDTFVDEHGEKRRDLLSVAAIYRDQKLYENAEEVLQKVQRKNPESLLVVDRMAELYRKWGKPERIEEAYRDWIEARGGKPDDYQLVGERLLRRQKYRQALPFLREAAENGTTQAWLQIADIYKKQRREIDMKGALETYIEKSSNRTRALRAALNRYRATSLTRETTEILEELIEREPGVRSHYERLGETYIAQGRRQEAFDLWRRYVERGSDRIEALRTVAGWFEQAGRAELILEFYRHWSDAEDPDPELYRLMGDAYMKLAPRRWSRRRFAPSRLDDARTHAQRHYEKYLEEASPSNTELTDFADSMRQSQMWSTAAEAYRRLVDSVASGSTIRLHYGQAMLHLGRAERAMQAFETYYDARGKTPSDAKKIATYLFKFRYLERAEPFLDRMFEADDGDLVQSSFVKLTEVYQHTGRSDRISELVTDFLNRAPNPAKARQLSVQVLERRGLYGAAAEQIRRIREFQGNVMGFELGTNLFFAGDDQAARDAFRDHADESPYSGAVWLKVAKFYESHARPERAMAAYDQAVRAAPDDHKPRQARGRFQMLQGNFEAARADFEDALDRANTKHRDGIRKAHVNALVAVGRHARAAQLAKSSLKSASQHRGSFLKVLAEHEFKTGDESRVSRMVQRLASSSLALDESVNLLVENGHRAAAAELIRDELDSGNYSSAGRAMVNRPGVFTRIGGIQALKRAARPLLKQQNGESMIRAQLGEYFIRQGRFDEGIVYLRSSMDDGRPLFQNVLGQTYAREGRLREASEIFQRSLRKIPENMRRQALRRVGIRLELAGQYGSFETLLRNLARDQTYSGAATGLLAEQLIATGGFEDAIGRIRRMVERLEERTDGGAELSLDRQATVESLLAALEGIAGAGYREEAAAILADLPESVRQTPDVREFSFHLAAARGAEDLSDRVDTALERLDAETSSSARERRISYARALNINGHYELSRKLAAPALRSADHKSIQNATLFLIRNAYTSDQPERIDQLAQQLEQSVSDGLRAKSQVGRTLVALGLDTRGLARLRSVAERAPTSENVRAALDAALAGGSRKASTSLLARYLRVAEQPLSTLESRLNRLVDRQDPALVRSMLTPYLRTYPADLSMRLLDARLAFREGDVERGRERLRSYLEEVDSRPRAVENVLQFLDTNGLAYEAADVFGPEIDDGALTPKASRYLGYAHLQMGREEKARSYLDRAVSNAADSAQAATEIAKQLQQDDHPDMALVYGDRAVELAPDRPAGRLFRGLARLSTGDVEAAERDLEVGLGSGINRLYSLSRAGKAALEAGAKELAATYLRRLATTPNSDDFGVLMPLRLAIDAYTSSEHAEAGVTFLESNFPRIASGHGVASHEILPQISGLYERAGQPERSFEIYGNGIRRELVRAPTGSVVPVYLNNLAYTYSTTNQHIDRGFDLARRAISAARSRTPSYLDTLGWLHYRRGDLDRAEGHVRRALRTSQGRASALVELYEHLADIRAARGDTEAAFWMRRFYNSLD